MPPPPVNPGFFDKTNYVIDAWTNPCQAPWYIYVETMLPAALEAFIMFISFGFGDVARGWARPRGLDKRRTKKRKGKWAKRIPRWPELGNMLGAHLPFSEQVKGRRWSCAGKNLWRIDGVAQRFLFWWLVADITNDFAFNWTSLLYETVWCKNADKGGFSWQTDGRNVIPGNVWQTLSFRLKDYENPFPNWVIQFGNSGPEGATICAAVGFTERPPFDPPSSYQIRVVEKGSLTVYYETGPMDADPFGALQCPLNGNVPPGKQFIVQALHDAAWAYYQDGVVIGIEP